MRLCYACLQIFCHLPPTSLTSRRMALLSLQGQPPWLQHHMQQNDCNHDTTQRITVTVAPYVAQWQHPQHSRSTTTATVTLHVRKDSDHGACTRHNNHNVCISPYLHSQDRASGLAIPLLSQALGFSAAVPPFKFLTSTWFPKLHN
jgi:hypothetical protein